MNHSVDERCEALDQYNQGPREFLHDRDEEMKLNVVERAEEEGVDLPEEIAEDYSATGMAVRCQFCLASLAKEPWRVFATSRWQNYQKHWFAHEKFNRGEYNRLLSLFNLPNFT